MVNNCKKCFIRTLQPEVELYISVHISTYILHTIIHMYTRLKNVESTFSRVSHNAPVYLYMRQKLLDMAFSELSDNIMISESKTPYLEFK